MINEKKKQKRFANAKMVNFLSGLLIMGMSFWILLDSGAAIEFFVILISLSLVILGIARIFVGLGQIDMDNNARSMKIISGLFSLLIGLTINLIDYRFSAVNIAVLFSLTSLVLIIVGFSRFFRGIQAKRYPLWYRISILVAGITSLVISILIGLTNLNLVIVIPDYRVQSILFAYTLIVLAITRMSLIFVKKE